ncbi:MAG: 50S ribosomal protein L25 [Buchnera aphidicola (Meitanaphis elongallis)]
MITIDVIKRKTEGKSASRRLRLQNKFPAVIYCNTGSNICIELDHNMIANIVLNLDIYQEELFFTIDNVKYKVKVKSIQRHVFKPKIMHMDFFQI